MKDDTLRRILWVLAAAGICLLAAAAIFGEQPPVHEKNGVWRVAESSTK